MFNWTISPIDGSISITTDPKNKPTRVVQQFATTLDSVRRDFRLVSGDTPANPCQYIKVGCAVRGVVLRTHIRTLHAHCARLHAAPPSLQVDIFGSACLRPMLWLGFDVGESATDTCESPLRCRRGALGGGGLGLSGGPPSSTHTPGHLARSVQTRSPCRPPPRGCGAVSWASCTTTGPPVRGDDGQRATLGRPTRARHGACLTCSARSSPPSCDAGTNTSYILTTQVSVWPNTYPFPPCSGQGCMGNLV